MSDAEQEKDGKPDNAKEELARNAEKRGGGNNDEAVGDYIDSEDSYSRDPDSVEP